MATALFVCALSYDQPAAAQDTKGTLSGTAKDAAGSSLQGALVQVDPLGKRVVTDNQGQFRLADIPAGDYKF